MATTWPYSGYTRPIFHVEWNCNYVWNVATLTWDPMTQPGGGAGGGMTDAEFAGHLPLQVQLLDSGGDPNGASFPEAVRLFDGFGQSFGEVGSPIFITNTFDDTGLGEPTPQFAMPARWGFGWYYNGATWDRVRGTAASGAWADIKASITLPVNITQQGGVAVSLNTGVRDAGTQRVTIATNDLVPVSGTVTTTPPANASTNVAQLAGTATSVNSGTKDAGTLRVVLATDQPALTNKLLVTPDSVALPANQSVNVAQMGGVATSMNTGVRDAGTQRVTIATNDSVPVTLAANQSVNVAQLSGTATAVNSGAKDAGTLRVVLATDQPALTNKLLVTPDSVALPANQSTNVNQFGGSAVVTGAGAGGAGIPRVTVSNDSAPTLTKGTQGATGYSTQDLKDAGRNQTNYFHAVPIITTVAEVMQTLTGYKGGVAVAATATPAVVTAGKVYRINNIIITYWAATAIGGARVNLRANLTGVGVVGSPLVCSWQVGMPAVFTAGAAMTYTFPFPDGLEFAAGTGIAIGVIGEGAVPTTATIVGYVMISIHGYEY